MEHVEQNTNDPFDILLTRGRETHIVQMEKGKYHKCPDSRYSKITRQSKQCRFSIYTFDNLKSKSMVRLVRAEKMVLSGLVFAKKLARMILIQNI